MNGIRRKQNMYYTQLDYIKILLEEDNKKEAYVNLQKIIHHLEKQIKKEKINETEKEYN